MKDRNHIHRSGSSQPPDDANQSLSLSMDGVSVVHRDLQIISFSEEAERITGFSMEEAAGKDIADIFGNEVSKPSFPIQETLAKGTIYSNLEIHSAHRNGDDITLSVSLSPLYNIHGDIAGAVMTFRDVAEMGRLVRELRERDYDLLSEKGKREDILNSITDGVFTIDADWRITSFNRAAERITGYPTDEALGAYCDRLLKGSVCEGSCPMRRTIETGQPTYNIEVTIQRKDGLSKPISVNTALLYDHDGIPIGAVETFRDLSKIRQLEEELDRRYRFDTILGKSKPMQELYELLENVVESDATVLIQGESGTGKELVARALHHNGARRGKPFIAVNCSALAENLLESELFGHERGAFTGAVRQKPGRFELANGGTLFLDEIGDMSPTLQVKLLRVLDEQVFERVGGTKPLQVDVRIIAATNKDLPGEVKKGHFREDLYYRLNVVSVRLPPLRQRFDDIPMLTDHFIAHFSRKLNRPISSLSPESMRLLMDYSWPGNIRELENAIEQALVLCRGSEIEARHLPGALQANSEAREGEQGISEQDPLGQGEKQVLLRVLQEVNGSRTLAAKRLGISKATLWRKLNKHGLLKSHS
jgi:PAS domain S-box-containing protein